MFSEVSLTELEQAILSAIPRDEWITRKQIAENLGKSFLNWNDLKVLSRLVERGFVSADKRKIALVKTEYIYRAN